MANLGNNFYPKLVQMTSELGMKPEDLLAIMVSESGIRPDVGKSGSAAGLIQFIPGTLPGTGFQGNTDDFRALSGEAQLPYIKKYIEGVMQKNGGRPFTSAAKYYVANFIPEALKLSGIRHEDPSYKFIEENPETIMDPHSGKIFSKKYYEIGDRITPQEERSWYRDNPLFHGSVPGAITYGDMIKQVEKNKKSSLYQKALMAMNESTGYHPESNIDQKGLAYFQNQHDKYNFISKKPEQSISDNILSMIEGFLQKLKLAEKNNKNLYKNFLPSNQINIKINSSDYTSAIEFARILSYALNEELMAKTFIHTNDNKTEVDCSILGPEKECFETVKQLTNVLTEVFSEATIKIGKVKINTEFIMNKKSSYQEISLESAATQYRKFLLKFV